MGGGLESCCIGHVYGADGAVQLVLSSWGVVRVNNQLKRGVSDHLGFVRESVSFLGGGIICMYICI